MTAKQPTTTLPDNTQAAQNAWQFLGKTDQFTMIGDEGLKMTHGK